MENTMEIPKARGKPQYDFNEILTRVLSGKSISVYIRRQDRLYVFEHLIDLIVEASFEKAKEFWKGIKQVFLENERYKPFIYYGDSELRLCHGKCEEDLSFHVNEDKDELYYQEHKVIVSPLVLQRFYDKYRKATTLEAKLEVDEYATYCISRELERDYEKKIKHII